MICVQIDQHTTLPNTITTLVEGKEISLNNSYDKNSYICRGGGSFSHSSNLCPSNPSSETAIAPVFVEEALPEIKEDLEEMRIPPTTKASLEHATLGKGV